VLVEELHPISTVWEGLGEALKVSKEHLEGIRHCKDPVVCLRKTLQKWLQDIRGWSRLVDALRLVREDKLCESLKAKYGELTRKLSLLHTHAELILNTASETYYYYFYVVATF